jgi:hypothetical protein
VARRGSTSSGRRAARTPGSGRPGFGFRSP